MPTPKPTKGEKRGSFISRCISVVSKEKPHKQAVAICHKQWRNHSEEREKAEDLLTTDTNNKVTMDINFRYGSSIDFEGEPNDDSLPLMVKGVSLRAGYIDNKHFIIPHSELSGLARTLKTGEDGEGAYFLKDHGYESAFTGKSVDKLVGRITAAKKVEDEVHYEARVEDADMAHKIRTKLVTASSVGIHVGKMLCSICGREYGHEECNHMLGQEYPDEGLHDIAKDYLDDMKGKPLAAIVGKKMEAMEQSVVLFPAIKGASVGASVGMNFDEGTENFVLGVEALKKQHFDTISGQETDELVTILAKIDEIEGSVDDLTVTFNKHLNPTIVRNTLELEQLTQDLADAKVAATEAKNKADALENDKIALESALSDAGDKVLELQSKLDAANDKIKTQTDVIDKYASDEADRLAEAKTDLAEKLKGLREELELPEKDYEGKSLESMADELELLESLPKKSETAGHVPGDDDKHTASAEAKEDVREVIFKKRRSGDMKGIRSLPKVD
jgi:hypothetical protein